MRRRWITSADIITSWRFKTGARTERLVVLGAAWEKEFGHMARHWKLQGIQKGFIYISPQSPAAAMELRMQSSSMLRSLNKYFKSPWIKGIKTGTGMRSGKQNGIKERNEELS